MVSDRTGRSEQSIYMPATSNHALVNLKISRRAILMGCGILWIKADRRFTWMPQHPRHSRGASRVAFVRVALLDRRQVAYKNQLTRNRFPEKVPLAAKFQFNLSKIEGKSHSKIG